MNRMFRHRSSGRDRNNRSLVGRIEKLEDRSLLAANLTLLGSQSLVTNQEENVSNEVGANQQEMMLAVDPANPLNVAAFSHRQTKFENQARNSINLFVSDDGGSTWNQILIDDGTLGFDDGLGPGDRFDPTVVFDSQGRLYVGYGHTESPAISLVVARTDDLGSTWISSPQSTFTTLVDLVDLTQGQEGRPDKWHLATGVDGSDPTKTAVYIAYSILSEPGPNGTGGNNYVKGTNDGGSTFWAIDENDQLVLNERGAPINDITSGLRLYAHPAVGSAGELYFSWLEYGDSAASIPTNLLIDRDLDGLWGPSDFGDDDVVASFDSALDERTVVPAQPARGIAAIPVIDTDQNSGRVYVTWIQPEDQPFCTNPSGSNCNTDVYVAWSDDVQNAQVVNPTWNMSGTDGRIDTASSTDFLPWIDVDQTTGSVNVLYYQSAELDGGTNEQVNVVVRTSDDGGASFSERVIVTTELLEAGLYEDSLLVNRSFMEYIGLAVHGGTLHAIWADNRENPKDDYEIYYANASFRSTDNTLTITGDDDGTPADDTITVRLSSENEDYLEVVFGDSQNEVLQYAGLAASVSQITIDGLAGNDTITVDARVAADVEINGSTGEDEVVLTLLGTGGESRLQSFVYDGGDNDDLFTIDLQNGEPYPLPGFNFEYRGGSGVNQAVVLESSGTKQAFFVNLPTDGTDATPNNVPGYSFPVADTNLSQPGEQATLRAAVQQAVASGAGSYVFLPAFDPIQLTLTGSESDATNDIDVTGDINIIGSGAGVSVIEGFDTSYTGPADQKQIFHVSGSSAALSLSRITLTGTETTTAGIRYGGGGVRADNGATFILTDSAIVGNSDNNPGGAIGLGIASVSAFTTIESSVFTANEGFGGTAVYSSGSGSLTIGDSIFALNAATVAFPNVMIEWESMAQLTNNGNNLYDDVTGGFFDTTPGAGDHPGTPDYVVTSVADTFNTVPDLSRLSLREAVDLANDSLNTSEEIWMPGWGFVLTLTGQGNPFDTSVNDVDVLGDLVIRGVAGETSIQWHPAVVDPIFTLIGDLQGNDFDVDILDFGVFSDEFSDILSTLNGDFNGNGDVDILDFGDFADGLDSVLLILNVIGV